MQLKTIEKIKGAFIDTRSHGARGAALNDRANLSNIDVLLENNNCLTFTAIEHNGGKHNRLDETVISVNYRGDQIFTGTFMELVNRLR